MDISLFHDLEAWILSVFNKEAIAIFAVLCVAFFGTATYVAIYAWRSGEFRDMESVKYDVLNL
ncbi:MAG: hypothetical protein HOA17_09245 [Candidatus Melainabacteria bacterium]|nr:hypothetical protein [Candidatus Melainabacteria bacterium]